METDMLHIYKFSVNEAELEGKKKYIVKKFQ
jgi:hypothetical protein